MKIIEGRKALDRLRRERESERQEPESLALTSFQNQKSKIQQLFDGVNVIEDRFRVMLHQLKIQK